MSALRITVVALLAVSGMAQAQTATTAASAPVATTVKANTAAPSQKVKPAAKQSAPAPSTTMDLHAPPLSHIYARQDLAYILAYDPDSDIADGEVSVRGSKSGYNVPVSPGNQLQAIPWALFHPTEAWRILTPVESP